MDNDMKSCITTARNFTVHKYDNHTWKFGLYYLYKWPYGGYTLYKEGKMIADTDYGISTEHEGMQSLVAIVRAKI